MTDKEIYNRVKEEIEQSQLNPNIKIQLDAELSKNKKSKILRRGAFISVFGVLVLVICFSIIPLLSIPNENRILYDDNSTSETATYGEILDIAKNKHIKIPNELWLNIPLQRGYKIIEQEKVCAIRLDYVDQERKVTVYISISSTYALHDMFAGLPKKFDKDGVSVKASPDGYMYFFENDYSYYLYVKKLPSQQIQKMIEILI